MLNPKAFAQIFAHARASEATWWGADGRLRTAPADEPRFCRGGPYGAAELGLLLEPPTTNAVRNARCEPASPGAQPRHWGFVSSNGLDTSCVGTGVDDDTGLPYADIRYSGTPLSTSAHRAGLEGPGAAPAAAGQSWTHSVWVKLVAGAVPAGSPLSVEVRELAGATGLLQSGTAFVPAAAWQRVAHTRTLNQAGVDNVVPTVRLGYTQGVAYDFTVRFAAPQLEMLPFATSVVLPPAGAPGASSRAADACTAALDAAWHDPAASTLMVEFTTDGAAPAGFAAIAGLLEAAAPGNAAEVLWNGAGGRVELMVSAGGSPAWTSGTATPEALVAGPAGTGPVARVALAAAENDQGGAVDPRAGEGASTPRPASGAVALPAAFDRLRLGGRTGGGGAVAIRVRDVEMAARRMSNPELLHWILS